MISSRQTMQRQVEILKKTDFSIQDILRVLLSNIVWILLSAAVVGFAAWAYTTYKIPKMYQTTVKFYAESIVDRADSSSITASELSSNKQLAINCAYIFQSNSVMKSASEELAEKYGLRISYGSLQRMTKMTTTNSAVFSATVSTSDRANIKIIANTIANSGIKRIEDIVDYGHVKVLDYAETPGGPYSPSVSSNTMIGVAIGLTLAAIFFIIRALTDTTVWNEEDLSKQYEIPVLGTIPMLASAEKQNANAYTADKE